MKIKIQYIYLILFFVFIVSLVIFSSSAREGNSGKLNEFEQGMHDDDIHHGIEKSNFNAPSKSNVTKEALNKLNQLRMEYEKDPEDSPKIRNYADMLLLAHQNQKAIELYEKILKVDPKRMDVLFHLTYLYFNEGELDKAEETAKKILNLKNNHTLSLYNLGVILNTKGDFKQAKNYFKEGL